MILHVIFVKQMFKLRYLAHEFIVLLLVQNPITGSTTARLYQLRSKTQFHRDLVIPLCIGLKYHCPFSPRLVWTVQPPAMFAGLNIL